jgi:SlyX protein
VRSWELRGRPLETKRQAPNSALPVGADFADNFSMETERLDKIETKLAFLEEFLSKLQDEVVAGNSELARLSTEHSAIKEKLIQLTRDLEEIPNSKPPHY